MLQYLMENSLPVSFFELSKDQVTVFDIDAIDLNKDHWYALVIDFGIQDEIKMKTDDLPMSIIQEVINIDQITDFMKELIQMTGCNFNKQKLLIASHKSQEGYLNSLSLWKQYTKLDMKHTKIHRLFRVKQEGLISDFIQTNISLRKDAKYSFEKDMFKLMSNLIYGKLLYNARKLTMTPRLLQFPNGSSN